MKRKITSQNPVTEVELKRILTPYVTKSDLRNELDSLEKRIEGMFSEFSNMFFPAIDPLIKDITRASDRRSPRDSL